MRIQEREGCWVVVSSSNPVIQMLLVAMVHRDAWRSQYTEFM